MSWQVRKRFLARVSGLPTDMVTAMRSASLADALAHLDAVDRSIDDVRTELSELLYAAVGASADRIIRRELLALRRALFVAEMPRSSSSQTLNQLPEHDRKLIERAVNNIDERGRCVDEIRERFRLDLISSRRDLQAALDDVDFRMALLLSSPTLYTNVERYRRADAARLSSREEHIERGLLRYFTRAAMKATPFARFCAVAEGRFEGASEGGSAAFDGSPRVKIGHIRLNKRLHAILWSHLTKRTAVRRRLELSVNPTLGFQHDVRDGELRYLASLGGKEVFQRLKASPALGIVLQNVRSLPCPTLDAVSSSLTTDARVETSAMEAGAFVAALVECGLLYFRAVVEGQIVDWDRPLSSFLCGIEDAHATRFALMLTTLRRYAEEYSRSGVAARARIGQAIEYEVASAFADTGLDTASVPTPLLYEDASTEAVLHVPETTAVEQALDDLAQWVELTHTLAFPRAEQATMRHVFDLLYGPQCEAVPLLAFYEDYYREHYKAHVSATRVRPRGAPSTKTYDAANPYGLAFVSGILAARARLGRYVRAVWAERPDAEELRITLAEVKRIVGGIARPSDRTVGRSVSVFCQLSSTGNGQLTSSARLVVPQGQFYVGYGKYFSRFLYMLPERHRLELLDRNEQHAGDAVLAEICGDADFNANLHPRLLPKEISYPDGGFASHVGQLATVELEVERDPADLHLLRLVHRPTGKVVYPVDLGFLNPLQRPQLYQLLSRFSPSGSFGLALPDHFDAPAKTSFAAIVYRPRVVFGDCLVIGRARWDVPNHLLPIPAASEPAGDYLIRLARWRRQEGIPESVYVRIIPVQPRENAEPSGEAGGLARSDVGLTQQAIDGTGGEGPERMKVDQRTYSRTEVKEGRQSRDWRKPQYVNFMSPLHIGLFARLVVAFPAFRLILEEVYPEPAMLPRLGDSIFAHELVLQLDTEPSGTSW